ncbi:neuronal acetylcholine receptor subunit alpha-10-like [Mercenaria mercenaria]|uniref:neuronal acetylcholine receptor subunit alpha-10-like n=1 Tax=Mercenaria mercenaria TaxID=6596 RepID=UPI001E1DDCF0|nr:neuronal acetylcholine receptor subunit alpha-10-like [Mercenaria mercenaria]
MTCGHTRKIILEFFILIAVLVATTLADVNEYRLIRDLLRSYDKRIRPSLNASTPLNVTFGFSLSQIIDVDEKNQILTTNCWLNQMWIDYGLRWKPEKYGGLKVVRIPHDSVWKPDILLYNNADVSTHFSSISSNVIVTSDGNVTWLSMVIFKSSCAINVRYFPFDVQNCSMQFASWTYDGFQVNLVITTNEGDISNYIPNSEWDLIKLYVERNVVYYSCCVEPYPDITYSIYIKRRPLFYIFNMFLPCILITLVALLGFYIPSDSGEKVTMGITTLLSMTVFMMLVAENMPPTSNVLPLIGIYYGFTIFIVSTATGMTVMTLNIHHKGHRGHHVPQFLKTICFGVFSKLFCMQMEIPHRPGEQYLSTTYTPADPSDGQYIRYKMSDSEGTSNVDTSHRNQNQTFILNQLSEHNLFPGSRVRPDSSRTTCNGFGPMNGVSQSQSPQNLSQPPDKEHTSDDNFERFFIHVLTKLNSTIELNEKRLADQDERERIKLEWQHVARVVDRILLTVFMIVTLTITCAIMSQSE